MHSAMVLTCRKRTPCWCFYWSSRRALCYVCSNTVVSLYISGYVHHKIRTVAKMHTVLFYVWSRCTRFVQIVPGLEL